MSNYSKHVQELERLASIPAGSRVYLAVPYSSDDDIEKVIRFEKVSWAASALIHCAGWAVFSPISQSHPIGQYDAVGSGWDVWEKIDIPWVSVSEYVVVLCLPGWRQSVGVTAEIAYAKEHGIPVMYVDEEDINLLLDLAAPEDDGSTFKSKFRLLTVLMQCKEDIAQNRLDYYKSAAELEEDKD